MQTRGLHGVDEGGEVGGERRAEVHEHDVAGPQVRGQLVLHGAAVDLGDPVHDGAHAAGGCRALGVGVVGAARRAEQDRAAAELLLLEVGHAADLLLLLRVGERAHVRVRHRVVLDEAARTREVDKEPRVVVDEQVGEEQRRPHPVLLQQRKLEGLLHQAVVDGEEHDGLSRLDARYHRREAGLHRRDGGVGVSDGKQRRRGRGDQRRGVGARLEGVRTAAGRTGLEHGYDQQRGDDADGRARARRSREVMGRGPHASKCALAQATISIGDGHQRWRASSANP
ncbi:MAG TPA: hypothetical protein VHC63_02585 [Acidimicrobiales bacterium]|nr:hypothetical protein [Acidimicrobiales bacterium]